jgi:ABC-2 type transport system permease protein
MMLISVVTIFFMVPGIVSMGIGLGAMYPDFRSENPAQSVTSFGGLMYMTFCVGFIGSVIVLEAGPVYHLFMTGIGRKGLTLIQWVWLVGSFAIVLALCGMAVWIPMRLGAQRIFQNEWVE